MTPSSASQSRPNIIIVARPGMGPAASFAPPLSIFERHRRLCLFGALIDGFCLTTRNMEYLSQKTSKFNCLAELPAGGSCGQMFIKRYKGDSKSMRGRTSNSRSPSVASSAQRLFA
jgi:hypothetical protein